MDIGVIEAFAVGEDGDAGLALHALHQGFAAARDEEVDEAGGGEHGGDVGAAGGGGGLHAGFWQPGRL